MKAISAQSLSHFFKVAISIAIFILMACLALLGVVSLVEKAGFGYLCFKFEWIWEVFN